MRFLVTVKLIFRLIYRSKISWQPFPHPGGEGKEEEKGGGAERGGGYYSRMHRRICREHRVIRRERGWLWKRQVVSKTGSDRWRKERERLNDEATIDDVSSTSVFRDVDRTPAPETIIINVLRTPAVCSPARPPTKTFPPRNRGRARARIPATYVKYATCRASVRRKFPPKLNFPRDRE